MALLPTYIEIEQWTDEKLLTVISSGEKINWNIQLGETEEEIKFYISIIYEEAEKRHLIIN